MSKVVQLVNLEKRLVLVEEVSVACWSVVARCSRAVKPWLAIRVVHLFNWVIHLTVLTFSSVVDLCVRSRKFGDVTVGGFVLWQVEGEHWLVKVVVSEPIIRLALCQVPCRGFVI